jgi:drug/metabolite transporter (DMT)-like permease
MLLRSPGLSCFSMLGDVVPYRIPPTAAVIAWLLIGEAMPPLAWLGMALAAAGVAVANRRAAHRT